MVQITPFSSKSSGSAVVLEPESIWPARAFAEAADCDRVVIMYADPNLCASRLIERIVNQSSEFERPGAKLRSVILACAGCDSASNARRLQLASALLPLLTSGEGRLVLTTAPNRKTSIDILLELAETLSIELRKRSIALVVNDWEVTIPAPNPRKDSGVFSSRPEDHRSLVPNAWPQNAKFQEAVGDAM